MGTYEPSGDQLVSQSKSAIFNAQYGKSYSTAVRSKAQTRNDSFSVPGGGSVSNPGATEKFAYSPGSLQAFGTSSTTKAFS